MSVQPGLRGSNDLSVGRKMATFQLFFQSGRAKDLSAPLVTYLAVCLLLKQTENSNTGCIIYCHFSQSAVQQNALCPASHYCVPSFPQFTSAESGGTSSEIRWFWGHSAWRCRSSSHRDGSCRDVTRCYSVLRNEYWVALTDVKSTGDAYVRTISMAVR